jgi:hypothetical protein
LFFEKGSPFVAQAGLKVESLLPQHPEWWNNGHDPPHLASTCVFNKHSENPLCARHWDTAVNDAKLLSVELTFFIGRQKVM